MNRTLLIVVFIVAFLAACTHPAAVPSTVTVVLPTAVPTLTLLPTVMLTPTLEPTATATALPTRGIGSTSISPADGMEMVYVPAGPFLMGYNGGYSDEGPQHTVTLDAYWIDRTEVTAGKYALCVQAGACKPPVRKTTNAIDNFYGNPDYADWPVIYVNWADAEAYCSWAGRRLPTEAEWEKAARGVEGALYPWGNASPDETLALFGNHIEDVVKTGSYPAGASPFGALDMAGNAWEWTADWYSSDYYSHSPTADPPGPESGERKSMRGGSWNFDTPGLRASYRLAKEPTYASADVGFRCMQPSP